MVNLAILVNGCQPIGARSRRIAARLIRITARDGSEAVARRSRIWRTAAARLREGTCETVLVTLGVSTRTPRKTSFSARRSRGGRAIELVELPHGRGLASSSLPRRWW